jgi:hypothetical protein
MAPLSAFAATTPAYDTTTDAPIYLMDGTTATAIASGTQLDFVYLNTIVLTANPVPADLGDLSWASFPAVAGSTHYIGFLSAVGSERTPSAWKQWSSFGSSTSGVLLPSVYPGYLSFGAPAATKAAGGTYSMGIAYTDSNALGSTHVIKAFYTTINMDAGTGTWTFAEPAAAPTDVSTTTTISASPTTLSTGSNTTLTATVTATGKTVTGNVEFYEGSTKLATTALAGGIGTKSITVGSDGAHTYTAKFVGNTVGSDKFLASTSATGVVVTATTPPPPAVPNAPSENALNAATANGATASYNAGTHKATLTVDAGNNGKKVNVFAYSTPSYLGTIDSVAGGAVTVDVSTLAAGTHKLVMTDFTAGDVLAWASFNKSDEATSPSISKTINADVANGTTPADGEFSLTNLSSDTVNLTNPTLVNGKSVVSGELGNFKVTDLRLVSKPGWDLNTTVTDFTKGTDTIDKEALGIAPSLVSQAGSGATAPTLGTAQVSGSAVYPWKFATLPSTNYSGVTTYNADLVFTAPAGKPAGTYSSTLTLTLVSK